MDSKQIRQHRLPPAAYWFLFALDDLGPSRIADLLKLEVFSLHAIHEGAKMALERGLCIKDGPIWCLTHSENPETSKNYTSENQQSLSKSTIEKSKNSENSEYNPRDLSSLEDLSLKADKSDKNLAVIASKGTYDDLARAKPNSENSEEWNLLSEYADKILGLDSKTIGTLRSVCGNLSTLAQVLDGYNWQHVLAHGREIGSVIGWARTTAKNGLNRQIPREATFAAWKRARLAAAVPAAQQGPIERPEPPPQTPEQKKISEEIRAQRVRDNRVDYERRKRFAGA